MSARERREAVWMIVSTLWDPLCVNVEGEATDWHPTVQHVKVRRYRNIRTVLVN